MLLKSLPVSETDQDMRIDRLVLRLLPQYQDPTT